MFRMFQAKQYPGGPDANRYTLIELSPGPSIVAREVAPVDMDKPLDNPAALFLREEAEHLANALNMAERLVYTVTVITSTVLGTPSGLSHGANSREETITHQFSGERAYERAMACYNSESTRITERGRWPGFVTTIDLAAAIHSIASVEI